MTAKQDRERAVERLLRTTRRETVSQSSCVDAESLAAWSEGTLLVAEARGIEAHLSECARCQSMLAAFARAEPRARVDARPFWHRWRLQWLVPAAAMATALAVWVAVPRDRSTASKLTAQRPAEVETSAELRAAQPDTGPGDKPTPTVRPESGQQIRESAGSQTRIGGRSADDNPTRDTAGRRREFAAEPEADRRAAQKFEPSQTTASADAATASAAPEAAAPSREAAGRLRESAEAIPAPAAPTSSPSAAQSRQSAARAMSAPSGFNQLQADAFRLAFEVLSPDGVHRWRIDSAGQPQHSSAGGAVWQPVSMTPQDVLTGGTSPGGSVCWLVGRRGAVWLTTDGLRFDRRPLPQPIDLVSVSSKDARAAAVVAVDGRAFSTLDGGLTWSPAAP